jgi:hypothetical protein
MPKQPGNGLLYARADGWLGIEESPYAFQHGKISLMMQYARAI